LVPVETPAVVKAKVATSIPTPLELREQVSVRSVIPVGGDQPLVKLPLQGVEVSSWTVSSQSLVDFGLMEGAIWVVVALVLAVPKGVTLSNGVVVSTPLKLTRLATLSVVPLLQV
jgi:hypothetical protein